MHFLLLQDSCYSAADGQKGGLSLLYQNRSPLSPVSQTTESDHVLTWHCRNEVVGRSEHKENPACAALQLLAPERETQRGIQVLHSMWNLSSPVRQPERNVQEAWWAAISSGLCYIYNRFTTARFRKRPGTTSLHSGSLEDVCDRS